jgi:hypothetical protein
MAPKSRVPEKSSTATSSASKPSKSGSLDAQDIVQGVWNKYVQKTPQRVKLLDSFMVFLIVVGVLQFTYCLIVGNFVRIVQGSIPTADPATTASFLNATSCSVSRLRSCMATHESAMANENRAALQRLPLRLQRNRGPVRPYRLPPHPDQPRKQGRIRKHFTRARICRLRLRLADPALLLHQLHKLSGIPRGLVWTVGVAVCGIGRKHDPGWASIGVLREGENPM